MWSTYLCCIYSGLMFWGKGIPPFLPRSVHTLTWGHLCMLDCFSHVWLCDPVDCSWPGSSVHGIFQERILELVAMPSSRGSFRPRNLTRISCIAGRFFTAEPPGMPSAGGMRQNNLQEIISMKAKVERVIQNGGCWRLNERGTSNWAWEHQGKSELWWVVWLKGQGHQWMWRMWGTLLPQLLAMDTWSCQPLQVFFTFRELPYPRSRSFPQWPWLNNAEI